MKNMKAFLGAAAALVSVVFVSASANAQTLTKELVGTFNIPLFVTHAPNDTSRLFVVEKDTGNVRIVDLSTGNTLVEPFVTVTGVQTAGGGFLGLAFHPDYENNGYFYVKFTGNDHIIIRRYSVDPTDPNKAIAGSVSEVIRILRPVPTHNGGWIGFSPNYDSYLYIGLGDGGSSVESQNMLSLLGKILRIDVDGDDFPADPNVNYAVPPSNPFIGVPSVRGEIWALGFRNPWRNSFDRDTGDLWTADVGQSEREEVNFQRGLSTGGENYGWQCMEGTRCTGMPGCTCNAPELTLPVHEYDHNFGCSISGGYVYRGCEIDSIHGQYFFADWCTDQIVSLEMDGGMVTSVNNWTSELSVGGSITSMVGFGEDANGELYICSFGGNVYRIKPVGPSAECSTCKADCDESGALNILDYICFGDAYASGSILADCDESGSLNILDYICFGDAFAAGCP